MIYRIAPLSAGFMLSSILGSVISALYVYPRSQPWGFTFFLFFVMMFVASLISMTYTPLDVELDADVKRERSRRKVKHKLR